jgi:hypothetical protein
MEQRHPRFGRLRDMRKGNDYKTRTFTPVKIKREARRSGERERSAGEQQQYENGPPESDLVDVPEREDTER